MTAVDVQYHFLKINYRLMQFSYKSKVIGTERFIRLEKMNTSCSGFCSIALLTAGLVPQAGTWIHNTDYSQRRMYEIYNLFEPFSLI